MDSFRKSQLEGKWWCLRLGGEAATWKYKPQVREMLPGRALVQQRTLERPSRAKRGLG